MGFKNANESNTQVVTARRLRPSCLAVLVLYCINSFFPSNVCPAETLSIIPEKETQSTGATEPAWKIKWDNARKFAKNHQYEQAAQLYKQLLGEKKQLAEAKREYSSILIELHEYAEAKKIIYQLSESDPENQEYALLSGRIAFAEKDYGTVVSLLQPIYDNQKGAVNADFLRDQLIVAYQSLRNTAKLYPLLEEKAKTRKNDNSLLLALARTANASGNAKDAQQHYMALIQSPSIDESLIIEAAEFFEKSGMVKDSVEIQEKYLKGHPGNISVRKRLLQHYLAIRDSSSALQNLLYLIDHGQDTDGELSLKAARILRDSENKPEKALVLFENVYLKHQDRKEVNTEILQLRHLIAKSILQSIETNGSGAVLQDFEKLNIDKIAIFKILAEDLEKTNKKQALINVLEVLRKTTDKGEQYSFQLARLYAAIHEYDMALKCYQSIQNPASRNFAYYHELARVEEKLDYFNDARVAYSEAIKNQPHNEKILFDCIKMLGDFGFVEELKNFGKLVGIGETNFAHQNIRLIYIEALRDNGLFDEAYQLYEKILSDNKIDAGEKFAVRYHMSRTLILENKSGEAEENLRLLILEHPEDIKLWLEIVRLHCLAGNQTDAWKWFSITVRQFALDNWKSRLDEKARLIFEQYINIKIANRDIHSAIQELESYFSEVKKSQPQNDCLQFAKLLARLYITNSEYEKAASTLEPFNNIVENDLEYASLMVLVKENAPDATVFQTKTTGTGFKKQVDQYRIFTIAANQASSVGKNSLAQRVIDKALAIQPNSQKALKEKAAIFHMLGRLEDSSTIYNQLLYNNPDERYFQQVVKELLFEQGNDDILTTMLAETNSQEESDKLIRARMLWREEKTDDSFKVYESLTKNSIQHDLQSGQSASVYNDFPEQHIQKKSSLWDIFSFSGPEEIEWLEKMTDPSEFAKNLSSSNSMLITSYYARLKFEKSVRIEYLARKALSEKKYKTAEKQYRQALQQENSQSTLEDLAKVYERLGDYGKEAEIYSILVGQGRDDTKLRESIEKNKLALAPQLSVDLQSLSKHGRQGAIDMREYDYAVNYRYFPSLTSEIKFRADEINYFAYSDSNKSANGRKISGDGKFNLTDTTAVHADVGLHSVDDNDYKKLFYNLGVEQKFDEMLKGYFSFTSSTIDDTLKAMEYGITKRGFIMGLELENQSGFNIGAEYRRQIYNDDENIENALNMWSSYSIYSDYTTIEFKYDYLLQKQTDSNSLITDADTGILYNNMKYWSPGAYWTHRVEMQYKHLLNEYEYFKNSSASYYVFDISAGYESENSMIYSGKFDIFLEMSNHYLLKGSVHMVHSDFYDEQQGVLSLIYRW